MNVDASQALRIVQCYQSESNAFKLLYAGQTVFLLDLVITFISEVQTIWLRKSGTIGTILFLLARYSGLANVAISLLPNAKAVGPSAAGTVLRLVTIMASECILIVRTWAIWERRRDIFCVLLVSAIVCVLPPIVFVSIDVATTKLEPPIAPFEELEHCRTLISKINSYVVPYVMAIVFESIILSLSFFRIAQLRNGVPKPLRMPFLDAILRDGIMYYFAVFALSVVNIVLVMTTGPQLRFASSQLQANFHSIVSTRLLLHLTELSNKRSMHGSSTRTRSDFWTTTGTEAMFTSYRATTAVVSDDEVENEWELRIPHRRRMTLEYVDSIPQRSSLTAAHNNVT
ncbi:hypothetical protein DL96DRAFT_11782 [Flagelloscypha sp. PMI_526]|nr:hypothetical protein DL96DRAFT_11782 [Flagelloscypha sp. PMI_526]